MRFFDKFFKTKPTASLRPPALPCGATVASYEAAHAVGLLQLDPVGPLQLPKFVGTLPFLLALTACAGTSLPPKPASPTNATVTPEYCHAEESGTHPSRQVMIACIRLSCSEGRAGSCYVVAREDDLRAKDPEAFRRVCKQACESGDDALENDLRAEACVDFGFEEHDPVRSANAFEKACNWNNARGCTALGLAYREGKGVPKDESRGNTLLSRACKLGEEYACKGSAGRPMVGP
jgi:hypothetical protein